MQGKMEVFDTVNTHSPGTEVTSGNCVMDLCYGIVLTMNIASAHEVTESENR